MSVDARPVDSENPDRFDPFRFARWLVVVCDEQGGEHAAVSDGYRRIRIDIGEGSLACGRPVLLHYLIEGKVGHATEARIMPLRRLAGLLRTGRFLPALFPAERRIERLVEVLRVSDALSAETSQRDIAAALFGDERVGPDWRTASDSLRSRVRRLVRRARQMSADGYRRLFRDDF